MIPRPWGFALLAVALASCGAPPEPRLSPPAPPANAAEPAPAKPAEARAAPRPPSVGPSGETANLMSSGVVIVLPSGADQVIASAELHPPPGDPSLVRIAPTALLYLDDGTLLVGMGDGTVTALDGAFRRRWSIGFRGAIRGLAPAGDGLVAVTTRRGVMALLGGDGRLRWERQVTAERLGPPAIAPGGLIIAASQRGVFAMSAGGELAFSHASPLLYRECESEAKGCNEEVLEIEQGGGEVRTGHGLRFRLDGPHPAVPSLEPAFPLTFRKILDGDVISLLPGGPDQLWALVRRPPKVEGDPILAHKYEDLHGTEFTEDRHELVLIEGDRTKRFTVPHAAAKKEVFMEGAPAELAPLFIDSLAAAPDGSPWILARRISLEKTPNMDSYFGRLVGVGQVLELNGGKVRERNDLFRLFAEHVTMNGIAVAPESREGLFCFAESCVTRGGAASSLIPAPGAIVSMHRIGAAEWLLTEDGRIFRRGAGGFSFVPGPDDASFKAFGGAGDRDVWADFKQRYVILRFDGARWAEVPVPAPARGFHARAADDVWSGRMRWDGGRWSIVHGAPYAKSVVARSRDEVWLGDSRGLWRGTSPGPSPVRLPPPKSPDEGAIPAALPLPLGAPDAGWTVDKSAFKVAGSAPLSAARNVSASPDGTLWMQTWDAVIEVDSAGAAAVVRRGAMESFSRWAYPETKGRGYILDRDEARGIDRRDEIRHVDRSWAVREDVQLDRHDAVAVHGHERGSTWVVGAPPVFGIASLFYEEAGAARAAGHSAREEFSPHALVRAGAGFRPVLGLPSAAWRDVAAAPDGGAWFAGALDDGPAGEGILFHARGRLGSEAATRYRAPASLLAVAAVSADEAWAVGAAGTVVHVRGGAITRYALASGEWLRAVFASGPDDVWIGGDGGTLLHHDGRAFHPVAHPLGARATITGIAASRGAVWAVGPSGILRITKRR